MSPRSVWRTVTLTAAAGLLATTVFGQGRGGGGGTTTPPAGSTGTGTTAPGTGTAPTTTTPGRTPTINQPTQQQQQQQVQMPQPIFVSGRVLFDDGAAPTEPVVIETICGATARAEGYTDTKGYFSFELGRRSGMLQDASESSGAFGGFGNDPFDRTSMSTGGMTTSRSSPGMGSDLRYMNCELRARLAGYRSQSVSLANRRPLDNPDVGVILMQRLGANEGTTVSASSLAAPKDARKAFEKAIEALKKKKQDDAFKELQKAVTVYPKYATAWFELGRLQAAKGDKEAARKSFDTALEADSKFVPPYLEIAVLDIQAQKWQEVADVTQKAIKLNSFDYPQVFFFNAVANYNLRNIEAAEESVRRAQKLDTRHQIPKVSHLLGIILAQRQDYTGAVEQLRAYLKFAPNASDADAVRTQLDQMEKISGGVVRQDQ
jgi:tetratricopeptide (TPR) repeat protein